MNEQLAKQLFVGGVNEVKRPNPQLLDKNKCVRHLHVLRHVQPVVQDTQDALVKMKDVWTDLVTSPNLTESTIEFLKQISDDRSNEKLRIGSTEWTEEHVPICGPHKYERFIYEGELNVEGQPHGFGVLKKASKSVGWIEIGTWKNQKRHGIMNWTHQDGNKNAGEYVEGKLDGKGTTLMKDGRTINWTR